MFSVRDDSDQDYLDLIDYNSAITIPNIIQCESLVYTYGQLESLTLTYLLLAISITVFFYYSSEVPPPRFCLFYWHVTVLHSEDEVCKS